MTAWLPPFRKKSRTAKPSALGSHSPPNVFSKSLNELIVTAPFTGPRRARPMNAVIDVATPVIVLTPLGISSTYTPGNVGDTGMTVTSFVTHGTALRGCRLSRDSEENDRPSPNRATRDGYSGGSGGQRPAEESRRAGGTDWTTTSRSSSNESSLTTSTCQHSRC